MKISSEQDIMLPTIKRSRYTKEGKDKFKELLGSFPS